MKKPVVLHPFFFAAFPALFFLSRNISRFPLMAVLAPAAALLVAAGALLCLLTMLLGSAGKAGVLTSSLMVLFTSYGHLAGALQDLRFKLWYPPGGLHVFLISSCAASFCVATYFVIRTGRDLRNLTKVLNVSGACLVAMSLFNITAYTLENWAPGRYAVEESQVSSAPPGPSQASSLPNIYYIILDAYARDDNLKQLYDYDNGAFLDYLKTRGFYVAGRSRTNYSQTDLSLASTLNLEYLDGLIEKIGDESSNRAPLHEMIANSKVREFLKSLGYRFVSFRSGFWATAIPDADYYLASGRMGEFGEGFWGTTAFSSAKRRRGRGRDRILYTFRHLPATAQLPGPLFVFAHIVAPHPPFFFTADGGPVVGYRFYKVKGAEGMICRKGVTRQEYLYMYTQQLAFVNKLATGAIDGIFEQSRIPPIIIVQGDHGPRTFAHANCLKATYLKDRMGILNAYYLPGGDDGLLYDSITPVNTFRMIFNRYFGAKYEPLEDHSYFATIAHPYRFTNVDEQIGSESDTRRLEVLKGLDYFPESISPDSRAGAGDAGKQDAEDL